MDFSTALRAARTGSKITRDGWNGPGQWAVVQHGYPDGIPINTNTAKATGIPEGTICVFRPYLMLRLADATFTPWTPANGDLFADDWRELP